MHSADRYANLVERVEKSVERVHKRYMQGDTVAYLDLIFGIGLEDVGYTPSAGPNVYAIADAIHNCHRKNPTAGIDEAYRKSLVTAIYSRESGLTVRRLLIYEKHKIEDGTNEIELNIQWLFELAGIVEKEI